MDVAGSRGGHRRPGRAIGLVVALALASMGVLAAGPAQAGVVINVPGDQPTIQAGIDAASNGDTVQVAAGTYFEHIDFKGKSIEVRGADASPFPTIDGGGTGHVVVFRSGETRASVLRGFRITHGVIPEAPGQSLLSGAGIAIDNSSPTIFGNVITENDGAGHGGGGIGAVGGVSADPRQPHHREPGERRGRDPGVQRHGRGGQERDREQRRR